MNGILVDLVKQLITTLTDANTPSHFIIPAVIAMRALKESLRIPDRMGWNGDPCAPAGWDAWEGVSCRTNKDGALVINQM